MLLVTRCRTIVPSFFNPLRPLLSAYLLHTIYFLLSSSALCLLTTYYLLLTLFLCPLPTYYILFTSYSLPLPFALCSSYPTLPSRLICSSFCASTANSIGSLLRTSFAYPFTIKPIASSVEIPRWLQ